MPRQRRRSRFVLCAFSLIVLMDGGARAQTNAQGEAQGAQSSAPATQSAPAAAAKPVPAARPPSSAAAAALKERLRALRAEQDALASQQRTILIELRRLDVDRQLKSTQIEETQSTLAGLDWSLQQTMQRMAQTEAALAAAKPAIRERVVRVYKLGRLGYTRLLLDLNDARTFQRTARVVSLLARRDRAQLDRHRTLVATLEAERARVAAERKTAAELQARLIGEREALARAIATQGARVKEIDERRDLNAALMAELTSAQERLSASVGRLAPTGVLPGARPAVPRYDWPLLGRIQTRFGRQENRFGTLIARNGIEIAADAGSAVKAIDAGRVAYADVFSGFGQIVILDHGQKTYSLYGHLSALAVQRGEPVERGRVVGSSGTTPMGAPAVYFELRIDGKPVDPVQWLKRYPSD